MNEKFRTAVAIIGAVVALVIVLARGPLAAAVIVALVGGLVGSFLVRPLKGGGDSTGIR